MGVFSRFLNYTNCTKSRNVPPMAKDSRDDLKEQSLSRSLTASESH